MSDLLSADWKKEISLGFPRVTDTRKKAGKCHFNMMSAKVDTNKITQWFQKTKQERVQPSHFCMLQLLNILWSKRQRAETEPQSRGKVFWKILMAADGLSGEASPSHLYRCLASCAANRHFNCFPFSQSHKASSIPVYTNCHPFCRQLKIIASSAWLWKASLVFFVQFKVILVSQQSEEIKDGLFVSSWGLNVLSYAVIVLMWWFYNVCFCQWL